jgi:hypothetical protein
MARWPDDMARRPDDMARWTDDMARCPDDMARRPDDMARWPDDMARWPIQLNDQDHNHKLFLEIPFLIQELIALNSQGVLKPADFSRL